MKTISFTKIRITTLIVSMCAFSIFAAGHASAETVVRTSSNYSLQEEEMVKGDLYLFSDVTSISGTVEGDMHVIGLQKITLNGPVGEDLAAVGADVQLHASVTDDVRIVAGEVTIAEHVGGDVFVIGGQLSVLSTAQVDGNVYFFGQNLTIEGPIAGSVFGNTQKARINATVSGDIDITVAQGLVLGDKANIEGSITHQSQTPVVRATNAVVLGDIQERTPERPRASVREMFVFPFMLMFGGLVLYLFGRRKIMGLAKDIETNPLLIGLVGLSGLVLIPFVSIILSVSVLGLLAGLFGFFFYGTIMLTTLLAIGPIVGGVIARKMGVPAINAVHAAMGILLVIFVGFIPIIGPMLLLIACILVLGSLLHRLYSMFR